MEPRIASIGLNIIIFSLAFIVISLIEGMEILLGVSFTSLLLGIIFLTIGVTYIEPLEKMLKESFQLSLNILNKLVEDTRLVDSNIVFTCTEPFTAIIISKKNLPCDKLSPGVGVYGETPYIMIPYTSETKEGEWVNLHIEGLRSRLRSEILGKFSLAKDIEIIPKSNEVTIILHDMYREITEYAKNPFNPVKIILAKILSETIKGGIVIEREEISGNTYRVEVKFRGFES